MRRVRRLFVGENGIAYWPLKHAWQKCSGGTLGAFSPPLLLTAVTIPSSESYPSESAVT